MNVLKSVVLPAGKGAGHLTRIGPVANWKYQRIMLELKVRLDQRKPGA